jgi:hypothetical protein
MTVALTYHQHIGRHKTGPVFAPDLVVEFVDCAIDEVRHAERKTRVEVGLGLFKLDLHRVARICIERGHGWVQVVCIWRERLWERDVCIRSEVHTLLVDSKRWALLR